MTTIRPLATIAILAALGVFLAKKINQGPIAPTASVTGAGEWDTAPAFAPDAASSGDTAASEAPSFGDAFGAAAADSPAENPPTGFPAPPASPPAASPNNAAPTIPELPPLPDLPAIDPSIASSPGNPAIGGASPAGPATGPTALDPNNLPDLPLPENIPAANYGRTAPSDAMNAGPAGATEAGQVSGRVPGFGTATTDLQPSDPTATPAGATPQAALTPPSFPTQPSPAPPEQSTTPQLGSLDATLPPANSAAPAVPYSSARVAVRAALDRDELPRAHLLLSQWYGDPTLTADERLEVDRLLGQLAGSVVYSNQHRLEPPHQVQTGETLESIASQYNVPWQLLAKINGVPRSDAVQPGQILKVVRGPFKAVIDTSDSELFLSINGRYAGRFPAQLDGVAVVEGAWKVADKATKYEPGSPSANDQGYAQSIQLSSLSPTGAGRLVIEGSSASPAASSPDGRISVASKDLGDLFDILSVGSEVTIRK